MEGGDGVEGSRTSQSDGHQLVHRPQNTSPARVSHRQRRQQKQGENSLNTRLIRHICGSISKTTSFSYSTCT